MGLGDDTELLVRMRRSRPQTSIYYDPDLFVYHLVHADKMTLSWAFRFNFTSGRAYRAFLTDTPANSPKRVTRLSLDLLRELAIIVVRAAQAPFRDRARHPYWQNYFYEVVVRRAFYLGRTIEQLVE
jgi:hypothetical protein